MGSILYADAIHIREQAKIDAARITQKSGNERRGAESALARFSAALANDAKLDAAGSNINDITGNIARNLDAVANGRLMERVAAAEELGANTAMAAAAGVGGSTVEQYNATVRLHREMQNEQNDRAVNSDLYLASESKANALKGAVASFDNNVYRADLDFTQYVDHKKPSMFSRLMTLGTAAVATYFGGPQAGSAVIGMFESKQAARNGDFDTASRTMNKALQQGVGAATQAFQSSSGANEKWASTQKVQDGSNITVTPFKWQGSGPVQYSSIRLN